MAALEAELVRLRRAAADLAAAEQGREQAMVARDAALRSARDAGATWDVLQETAGVARATVVKALRRS